MSTNDKVRLHLPFRTPMKSGYLIKSCNDLSYFHAAISKCI